MRSHRRHAGKAAAVALALAGLLALPSHGRAQEVSAQVLSALTALPKARVVILLREPEGRTSSLSRRAAEIDDTRQSVLGELSADEFRLTAQFVALSVVGGEVSLAGLKKLLQHPDVVRIDLDVPVRAALAESVPLIHADQVHNAGVTGRGVTVAVLDSGVEASHPDFKDRVVAEQCFCANPDGSGCCPNGSKEQSGSGAGKDEDGHGTNVAGVIASGGRVSPVGVAPDATIVNIRVLDKKGAAASTTQIMQGLDWIIATRPDVKIVNMSLATPNLFSGTCDGAASFTTGFAQAINTLRSRGVLTFVSSGNDGSPSQIAAPACVAGAIAVGATYDANVGSVSFGCNDATTGADRMACFSNSSSAVDMVAPGGATTGPGLGGGTSTYFGTSQAAPHAAGVAALLLSAKAGRSPDQIEQAMKNSGISVTDGKSGLTFKRIDAQAALAALP